MYTGSLHMSTSACLQFFGPLISFRLTSLTKTICKQGKGGGKRANTSGQLWLVNPCGMIMKMKWHLRVINKFTLFQNCFVYLTTEKNTLMIVNFWKYAHLDVFPQTPQTHSHTEDSFAFWDIPLSMRRDAVSPAFIVPKMDKMLLCMLFVAWTFCPLTSKMRSPKHRPLPLDDPPISDTV